MASATSPSMPADDSVGLCSRSSSPFVSELNAAGSRSPSKQFLAINQSSGSHGSRDHPTDVQATQFKLLQNNTLEEKENYPLHHKTNFLSSSPRGDTPICSRHDVAPRCSSIPYDIDAARMPPPTSRTLNRSPAKVTARMSLTRPSSRADLSIMSDSTSASPGRADPLRKQRQDTQGRQEQGSIDDTCFSTFSEVPDLMCLTKTDQSPYKRVNDLLSRSSAHSQPHTPRSSRKRCSPSRSPSPTPRRLKTPNANQESTSTFLIDFTQQIEGHQLPSSRTEPDLLQHLKKQRSPHKTYRQSLATPGKQSNILSLLDFELPPAPTPRSIPTITVRELETLKSQYLSQISSFKATLNGREAEVESLKRAVGDAERRVGDAQEALKEERTRREHAEQERADWERRGVEIENVLNTVREEVMRTESEKEQYLQKIDECEKQIEEAESRASRAEEGLAQALALRLASSGGADVADFDEQIQRLVTSQIDAKIEAVSRELHAVYKEKHERKVATLKKSYEARSEKRCAEMQTRLAELQKANAELSNAQHTMNDTSIPAESSGVQAELKAQIQEQQAHLARIEEELITSKAQQDELVRALEQERIEKGDLVAAVDEMLALQAESGPPHGAMSVVEDFRKSISRPQSAMSMTLRRPSESRIGKIPTARTPSGSKSKMLANIERMGRSLAHDAS